MSKNTGTSELINYFDLGANGDVGIAGSLDINTILQAGGDTDKFLVSDTGIIKYRTGAELLSDIGGQGALTNPVTGTGTSGTIPVFTGSTTIGNSIIQSNATQVNIVGNGSQLLFDSLGESKTGGIWYVNDFQLLINNSRGSGSSIYLGNVNMDFHTNVSGNPRLRITDGGNILVGTTTDNGAKFQVTNGNGISFSSRSGASNLYTYAAFGRTSDELAIGISGASDQFFTGSVVGDAVIKALGTNNRILLGYGNGIPALIINSSNNIGIGFTPSAWDNTVFRPLQLGASGSFLIGRTDAVSQTQLGTNAFYDGSNWKYIIGNSVAATRYYQNGGEHVFESAAAGTAGNNITWNPRLFISTTGNVGIGTVSPNSKFEIQGSTSSPQFRISRSEQTNQGLTIQAGGGVTLLDSYDGTDTVFGSYTFNSTKGTSIVTRMRIDGSGNVGINTATPSAQLSGTIGLSIVHATNAAVGLSNGTNHWLNYLSGTTYRIWNNSVAEVMTLTYSGNVLIGTTSDNGTKLQVSGNATINGSGNTLLVNSSNNSLALGVGFQGITSGYIGGISSALYGYSTNGGYVLLNSSSAWVPASDIKRKRNFEPYTKGISAILGLQPKLYNMDFQKDGDEKQVGLVAQEVREFIPLAYEENADFIGINYNAVIVTMVKAIQEQQQQIQELKNKLS
jgi:hypothetical protein